MWRALPLILLPVCVGLAPAAEPPPPGTMAGAVAWAYADAAKLDPQTAQRVRYFYLPPEDFGEREELYAALSWQLNAVSRGPNVRRPIRITAHLVRADLGDYRIDPVVFANARVKDTYFHTPVKGADGKVEHLIPAYLPHREYGGLAKLLGSPSASVIYRADWWVNAVGIEEERGDYGYYSLLGLKTEADADGLAGHDQKAAEKEYAEVAAAIRDSGITRFPRQVFRHGVRRGGRWETRDTGTPTGDGAALSRLFGDYKFDGKEIIFPLPNGMPAGVLANNKGGLVKSGPPNLVGDKRAEWNGNDARVHVGVGCFTCHLGGGMKPLNDYHRRAFRQGRGVGLASPDKDLSERIQRVYLGPLQDAYERDSGDFARAYTQAAGVPAAKVPDLLRRVWNRYAVESLSVERQAAELDTTPQRYRAALRWKMTKTPIDPALSGVVGPEDDPEPMRRETFEEAYPLLRAILTEYPG